MALISYRILAVLFGCLVLASGAQAKGNGACEELRAACLSAGFGQGGGAKADNVAFGCLKPLLDGVQPPGSGKIALPKVSSKKVEACRATKAKNGRAGNASSSSGASVGNAPTSAKALPAGSTPGPNIVLILVDDFSLDLMTEKNDVLAKSMPNLVQMQRDGVSFANYFVTNSLCCPSRSTIFTGLMPHNSGVLTNTGVDGGYEAFMSHQDDAKTFSVALNANYYATAMMGKYLNGYQPDQNGIPQGWSEWAVGGWAYANYNYSLNHNARLITPEAYLTDEISELGQAFIKDSASGPFFLELSTYSPHAPYTPPKRYANDFPDLTYPRSPAFGARPDDQAPTWLKSIPALNGKYISKIDEIYRMRVQSDKGIDDMIGAVRQTLKDQGLSDKTYVIFTSDNGYHLGEYSLRAGKMTPFDTDIHVPLVVVGPGIAAGKTVDEIAMNIDLSPTFTDLAGIPATGKVDGQSLVPLLHGKPGPRRSMAVVEHTHPETSKGDPDAAEANGGDPPNYVALRMGDAMYVEYLDGSNEVGYYDLNSDPYELHNIAGTLSAAKLKALHDAAMANQSCVGADQCLAAQSLVP